MIVPCGRQYSRGVHRDYCIRLVRIYTLVQVLVIEEGCQYEVINVIYLSRALEQIVVRCTGQTAQGENTITCVFIAELCSEKVLHGSVIRKYA